MPVNGRHTYMDGSEGYVYRDSKMLRRGYTTGTCAVAAAKAAAISAAGGVDSESVTVSLPNGGTLEIPCRRVPVDGYVYEVVKDGGDDIDATDGIAVRAEVALREEGGIEIRGGPGVGTVTKKGLDRPPGEPAINSVPLKMIRDSVSGAIGTGGAVVTVSVPDGERIAEKTFNSRLGIVGGISILGTSGIVDPMSTAAIVDTIRAEISVLSSEGRETVLAVPGNYGRGYAEELEGLDPDKAVKFGNYVGPLIDVASEFGIKRLLIVGNFGKLVKTAGGIMDTHSRNSDARMEIIGAHAAALGLGSGDVEKILGCVATDSALDVLKKRGIMEKTVSRLIDRMYFYLNNRAGDGLTVDVSVYSSEHGFLGRSPGALEAAEAFREGGR